MWYLSVSVFAKTAKERARNSAKVNRARVLLESWVEPKLRRAISEAGRQSALEYDRGGLGRVQAIALADYREDMAVILSDLYERTTRVMVSMVKDSAKSIDIVLETKGDEELDYVQVRMLEWFGVHAMEQAVLVSGTMADEVAFAVEAGIAEGLGEREIGRNIRKRVDGLAPWQANRIARTETLMASSKAQDDFIDGIDDLPPLAKEWDSSRDSRTRRSHRGVEPVLKNHLFQVGRYGMEYPGDSSAPPSEIVNCRCTVNYAPADQMPELEEEARQRVSDIEEDEAFDDDAFVEPDL